MNDMHDKALFAQHVGIEPEALKLIIFSPTTAVNDSSQIRSALGHNVYALYKRCLLTRDRCFRNVFL